MRTVLFVISLFFITGCSLPGVAYRYSDWLIKKRILEVIKLYSPQQDKLEEELDAYMLWHKKEMLPRYEDLLVKVKGTCGGVVDTSAVEANMSLLRKTYFATITPLTKRVIPILVTLKSEQVDRSKTLLMRKVDERKNRLSLTQSQLLQEKEKQWHDNFVDWFGSVNEEQNKLLKVTLPKLVISPKFTYSRSVESVQSFIEALESPAKERASALEKYFHQRQINDVYKQWRKITAQYLAEVLNRLTVKQRKHLTSKIDYWIGVVRDLKE